MTKFHNKHMKFIPCGGSEIAHVPSGQKSTLWIPGLLYFQSYLLKLQNIQVNEIYRYNNF